MRALFWLSLTPSFLDAWLFVPHFFFSLFSAISSQVMTWNHQHVCALRNISQHILDVRIEQCASIGGCCWDDFCRFVHMMWFHNWKVKWRIADGTTDKYDNDILCDRPSDRSICDLCARFISFANSMGFHGMRFVWRKYRYCCVAWSHPNSNVIMMINRNVLKSWSISFECSFSRHRQWFVSSHFSKWCEF